MSNAKDLLNKGLKIKEANGIKSDFSIAPEKKDIKLPLEMMNL